jgi:hypothetical protein
MEMKWNAGRSEAFNCIIFLNNEYRSSPHRINDSLLHVCGDIKMHPYLDKYNLICRLAGTVVEKQMKLAVVVIWHDTVELSVNIKIGRIITKYVVADQQIQLLQLTRMHLHVQLVVHVLGRL